MFGASSELASVMEFDFIQGDAQKPAIGHCGSKMLLYAVAQNFAKCGPIFPNSFTTE